jgi:hypothetical protein
MLELKLKDVVADRLVLWDADRVKVRLEDTVADVLELKLRDIDVDGELETAGPAPTATNAIFVD